MGDKTKAGSIFWPRAFSTLIDIVFIACVSYLVRLLITQFVFIDSLLLFNIISFSYYLLCYSFFRGQTLAKALTGLRLVGNKTMQLSRKQLFTREVSKGFILLLIPFYLLSHFLKEGTFFLFVLVPIVFLVATTLILQMIFIKTWWELSSGTMTIKDQIRKKRFRLVSLASLLGVFICTILLKVYPLKDSHAFKNTFYPEYPINSETEKYTGFISTHSQDPVDYVFSLFEKYDLVVLSERMHPEYTQYELISKIISDKRFTDKVGNIYTECGSVSFQDTLDTYLATAFDNEDSLNKSTAFLQRNSNAIWPLWSSTNLFDLLKHVNKLNSNLADSLKTNWYFTDIPVNWETMTPSKYKELPQDNKRDKIMANHIIDTYKNKIETNERRKKGFVIMNFRHGYGLIKDDKGRKRNHPHNQNNTTAFLMDSLPGKVCNVFINTISLRLGFIFTPIQHGKWDRAFSLLGNPNVGFDFENSPFGMDKFDAYVGSLSNELKYKDVFTGFIFYKPLEEHIQKTSFPYMLYNFEDSVLRRAKCVSASQAKHWENGITMYKNGKTQVNTMHYANFYNLVINVGFSIVALLAMIISLLFYWRKRDKPHIQQREYLVRATETV